MIAHTHRLVGEFLYDQLSPQMQELLHRRRFVYGNVKPDITKEYLKMSHYYRDNSEIIFGMLHRLLNTTQSKEKFSEDLGIILHFFCDYTCIYHANDYVHKNHSLRMHLQYEAKLHFYAAKQFKSLDVVQIIPFKCEDEIGDYVYQLTARLNQPMCPIDETRDFEEMVTLSLSVLLFVLNHQAERNN